MPKNNKPRRRKKSKKEPPQLIPKVLVPKKHAHLKKRELLKYIIKSIFQTSVACCSFTTTNFLSILFLVGLISIALLPKENPTLLHLSWSVLGTMFGWIVHAATDGGKALVCRKTLSGGYKELDHRLLNIRCDSSWMNLGYWKARPGRSGGDPKNYAQACENMCMLVGEHANLAPKDKLLDVGFGRGDQIGVWRKAFSVKSICGINLSFAEVAFARSQLSKYLTTNNTTNSNANSNNNNNSSNNNNNNNSNNSNNSNNNSSNSASLPNSTRHSATSSSSLSLSTPPSSPSIKNSITQQIKLDVGSATNLPYDDNTFTKVLSVDSAYHYCKRTDFMTEACRVLQPDGKLCMADIILPKKTTSCLGRLALRIVCAVSGIPRSNLICQETYLKQLEARGFVNAKVVAHLDNDVFLGWSAFMRKHKYEFGPMMQPSVFSTYSAAASMFDFIGRMQLLSFVVVVATKKRSSTKPGGDIHERDNRKSSPVAVTPPRINRMKSASAIHHFA